MHAIPHVAHGSPRELLPTETWSPNHNADARHGDIADIQARRPGTVAPQKSYHTADHAQSVRRAIDAVMEKV